MPTTMTIPDAIYAEAAEAIRSVRARSDKAASAIDIGHVLRAYVALGSIHKVPDWSWTLSDADKAKIADAVASKAYSMVGARFSPSKVYVDLEIMETLAASGAVAPNIARPNEWQARLDTAQATAPDITSINANISKVFGNLIPSTQTLVLIGAGVLAFYILTRR